MREKGQGNENVASWRVVIAKFTRQLKVGLVFWFQNISFAITLIKSKDALALYLPSSKLQTPSSLTHTPYSPSPPQISISFLPTSSDRSYISLVPPSIPMDNLISLVNKIQRACTALGDHGENSALPTLWDALPAIAVVGGQVCSDLTFSPSYY